MYKRELLFSKLGYLANKTLLEATRLCRIYRHDYVELEHWLKVLLDEEKGDVYLLLKFYQADCEQLKIRLERILHMMPNGSSVVHDLSGKIEHAVERGLIISQIENSAPAIRSGHILLGLLTDNDLRRWLYRLDREFEKINIPEAIDGFTSILAASVEYEPPAAASSDSVKSGLAGNSIEEAITELEKWCLDLTEEAHAGRIDPVVGRETELRQMIDILLRRRQNNPILVGEAGVGKTAVVEALALKIARDEVPKQLKNSKIMALDLGKLQAGTGVRGEFEERFKKIVAAVHKSAAPILLFCDEVHTLVGAGGQEGTGDAVNLLKPLLARGQLKMIGATTWSEYKQFIEPDTALTRRFQSVYIAEPDEQKAIAMVRMVTPYFSRHHQVIIRDSAVVAAVKLSSRYLPLRQLPDKAISLLDTACARVASSQHIAPAVIENYRAELSFLDNELMNLRQEAALGENIKDGAAIIKQKIAAVEAEIKLLTDKYSTEQELVRQIHAEGEPEDKKNIVTALSAAQAHKPLVFPWLDAAVISDVLSDWTGIPSERMIQDDLENSLTIEEQLNNYIFGQPQAVRQIGEKVKIALSGIQPNDSPLGVFLLTGPSGTGKTETAHALAELMYGGRYNLITFNMTEFQEAHSVSVLKGAPPGYVGYGKGGKLTEAVRQKPYSVILLDEFDKAHSDVHEIFYQVFDKGWMKDGEGRVISFKQCVIFLTSNIGAEEIEHAYAVDNKVKPAAVKTLIFNRLQQRFSPALLARMEIIPFLPLGEEALLHITAKELGRLQKHLGDELKITLSFDAAVCPWLVDKVRNHPNSGRAIKSLLEQTLLPPISREILLSKKQNRKIEKIALTTDTAGKMALDFL